MRTTGEFIADTYALGTGPWAMRSVTRGALGQIWKLSGNGSSWAVKELLFGCDERQVDRESTLRNTAEKLGISAPRLMPNRAGTHVSQLPPALGGSYVKLYDWVEGAQADASDPEILGWCGLTLAILHRAGEGASGTPDSWYEQCHQQAQWAGLLEDVHRAGVPWSDALGRFVATSAAELAHHVTPSAPGDVVMSHLDVQPQNVLVGPAGPVLLDWDNAGPISAERELARAVYVWSGGNRFRADSARRLVRAYRSAGGHAVIKGLESFSMLFATALNYVYVQAECAVDPAVTDVQREFASHQVVSSLRSFPDPIAVSRLAEALRSEW
ncbi:aminoglycoside phosphotransferase family protein [Streptomyces cavernae]|uniref:phosphotransferase n=1 Tax=Streptomyces cavernae TaxID=2259034 RepID=UPI000FEB9E37|nr:aminoglycoside phosphotransferase family protein [Streptomyces cavernae]